MNALKLSLFGLIATVLFIGCIPSLNPIYTDDTLVFEPAVLGRWKADDSGEMWTFEKASDKAYRLTYTNEKGETGRFLAHLSKMGGKMYLDLFPEKMESQGNAFYQFHTVPIHTIYLVKETTPDLKFAVFDYRRLEEILNENPQAIQHVTFNGRKLITAPTEELQAFVTAYEGAFSDEFHLKRAEVAAN